MEKLKIKDLQDELNLGEIGEQITEYSNGYISDIFSEIANYNIDIFTADLHEWASKNVNIIDEAMEMLGSRETFDDNITQAQFYFYQKDLYNNIEDILKYWAYDYLLNRLNLEYITADQNDEIDFLNWDRFDRLENVEAELENIFENEV